MKDVKLYRVLLKLPTVICIETRKCCLLMTYSDQGQHSMK